MPSALISKCRADGIEPIVVGFKSQTLEETMNDVSHLWTNLGRAGEIIRFFKKHDVSDLVMIGGIRRPAFSELRPDFKGVKILSKIGLQAMGDHALLSLLENELNHEGFTLHGIHDFMDDVLASSGVLGQCKPSDNDLQAIQIGVDASRKLGELDVGQSVIVQQNVIVSVEGVEGTDALIRRSADLLKPGIKGILVKTRKPQQSKNLDLPTIGVDTVRHAHDAGLSGIAVHANNCIIHDVSAVLKEADDKKLFVYGVDI